MNYDGRWQKNILTIMNLMEVMTKKDMMMNYDSLIFCTKGEIYFSMSGERYVVYFVLKKKILPVEIKVHTKNVTPKF